MKKTAGQIVLEHDQKRLELEDDVIEYRRKMEGKVVERVYSIPYEVKDKPYYQGSDFYVVLGFVEEHVLKAPKPLVWTRKSCPTPTYKQSVWKYHRASDTLEFLWHIPEQLTYYHILRNSQKFLEDKECAETAKFVLLMESGELLKWVKKENGNKIDAVIKIQ